MAEINRSSLDNIDSKLFRQFLLDNGWIEASRQPRQTIFLGPKDDTGNPIELALPRTDTYIDWKDRLVKAIELVSIVGKKSTSAVLIELLSMSQALPTTSKTTPDQGYHLAAGKSFVPVGLRSYGPDHAEIFQHLVPGPRDNRGIPESISFWQSRIESVDSNSSFDFGFILGQSGSGKTSFVKAGLLPSLNNSTVLPVYVDSGEDAQSTKSRLVKAISKETNLPIDSSISSFFASVVAHRRNADDKKILLVIDGFEHLLNSDSQDRQLVNALQHCDGRYIQCIIVVREDFWGPLSQFVENVGASIRLGINAQRVKPLDLDDARKLTGFLGRAYGRLPSSSEPNQDQLQFLDDVINRLSEFGHVICIRLVLFAEAFRYREWTMRELDRIRLDGSNAFFLPAIFEHANFDLGDRQVEIAKRILGELVNSTGMRTQVRSRQQLLDASQPVLPDEFQQAIEFLLNERKLISFVPLQDIHNENVESQMSRFQLTHDSLVPAVYEWRRIEMMKTWDGRLIARIQEAASVWGVTREERYLLGFSEYCRFCFLKPPRQWSACESELIEVSSRRLMKRMGVILLLSLLVTALIMILLRVF